MESNYLKDKYESKLKDLNSYKSVFLVLLGICFGVACTLDESASIGFFSLKGIWNLFALLSIVACHKCGTASESLKISFNLLLSMEKDPTTKEQTYKYAVEALERSFKEKLLDILFR